MDPNTDKSQEPVQEGEVVEEPVNPEPQPAVPTETLSEPKLETEEVKTPVLGEAEPPAEVVAEVEAKEAVSPTESAGLVSEPTQPVEEAEVPQPEAKKEEKNGYTARSEETGDKVYVVREEKRYWIKNPETLGKMGFYLGKEKKIPFSELLQFPEGEPIDLTIPNAVYPWDKPEGEKVEEPANDYKIWS